MDTRIKRILSFAVAFFMVIGMMPVNIVRAEGTEGDDTEIVAETTAPETTPHVCEYAAVVTAPTCEAAGFTTYTCSCGDTYTADEVEATGHTYGEDDKCACGALNPAHEHSYTSVVTAPTCDAAGYTTNTCVCGDVTTTDEVAATGHTYGEDDKCACGALNPEHEHSYTSVVTAPTCDAAGYTTNTCACGDVTTTDEVAATGHTYGENGKCACGTLDPAHEHTYVEGKCVCGDERILMMSPPPTAEPTVKPCEEGCWMEEGHEGECEIICTKDERCVLEDGHEGLCEAFGGVILVDLDNITTEAELLSAVATAQAGQTIVLQADITLTNPVTLPAGIILDGNGKTISGAIKAGGDLTFMNRTIVTDFGAGSGNTITIGEGASLKVAGGRITVSYGNVFDIRGNISSAKSVADKTAITPSLELVGGISFNGNGGGVQFNVENAYVILGDSTSKNSGADGVFNINFTNSIVDFTKTLKTYVPTAAGLNPTFNITAKDSVVSFASHLELWNPNTNLTLDNTDFIVGGSFANAGKIVVKSGADFTVKAPIMSSHGGNTGTITVDGGEFELVDSTEDWVNEGTIKVAGDGTLKINDFKCAEKGNLVVDITNRTSGDSPIVGIQNDDMEKLEVVGNANATLDDSGNLVFTPCVVSIDGTKYATLDEALDAAKAAGKTEIEVDILEDVKFSGKVNNFKKVTFNGTGRDQTVDMNINSNIELNTNLVFNDLTVSRLDGNWLYHYTYILGGLSFNNCKMVGLFNVTAQNTNFTGCDFHNDNTFGDGNYSLWLASCMDGVTVNITDCTFDVYERAIKMYGDGYNNSVMTLNISGTEFASRTADKTVVEMAYDNPTGNGFMQLNITNSTKAGFGAPEHAPKDAGANAWFNVEDASTKKTGSIVTVDGVVVYTDCAAKIGNRPYITLQQAVDAVKDGETIELIPGKGDYGYVEFTEDQNKKFTIDGKGVTWSYNGTESDTIKMNGAGGNGPDAIEPVVTIKNINFTTEKTAHDFIDSSETNYYPNLWIENCNFTGPENQTAVVAVRLKAANSTTIKGCSATGVHSLVQNTSGWNLTIQDCTVTATEGGLNLGTVQNAVIKNVTIVARDYGIRLDAQLDCPVTVENVTVTADVPVYVRYTTADGWKLTLNGENKLTAGEGKTAIILNKNKEVADWAQPEVRAFVITNDEGLTADDITGDVQTNGNVHMTKAAEAMVGAKYYDKLSEAVADGGNVVVLKDIELNAPIEIGTNVTLTAEEPVTITATGDAFTVKENASLTIGKNITIDASMTASGENAVLSVTEGTVASAKSVDGGKVNVTGGTVDKATAGQDGIVTISGGDIEAVELLAGASATSAITGGNIGTVTAADVEKFVSGGIFDNEVAQEYLKDGMECVKSADKFIVKKKVVFAAAYTKEGSIYGEAEHIVAYDSFVVELYDADGNVIATSALVDKADGSSELLDGYVELITWNILLPGTTDSWWNTQWADTHPRADIQPAKVVLKADGVKVGEANVQMNRADSLNPVKWPELHGVNVALVIDGEGNSTGYDTVIGAIHAAIDAKAPEVQLLVSTEEKMVTDEVLLLKADLTITAKEAVTAEFYNSGTSFDFIFNSESGEHTLTIGKNVNFTLADRVIWAGYYGNNVNVVVDGTLAGYQYWHGADTTINATGTLKTTGEALIMRLGATMTINGGKVDANYFNVLSGNIKAKDAVINTGKFGIDNTGGYAGEGSVYINLDNSSLISTGNLTVSASNTALIELVNGSVMTVVLHDGYAASTIGNTGMIWVDNSTLNMKAATLNGEIDVYNGGLLNLTGKLTNNGTVTVFADSMIEAATIDGTGNVVINTTEMTNTDPVAVMKLTGEYDAAKITVEGNAAKKIAAGDTDVVSVYFDVFVDADGDESVDVGEGYGTLEAAVAAAADGQTIYILHETGLNEQVVVDKNITITALDNVKVAANSTDAIVVASGATLTLGENVTFEAQVCANGGAVIVDGAAVTAVHAENGGTITVNSGAANAVSVTGANTALNVTGGSVASATSANGAQINVSGGTVGSVIANENGTANISAGEITNVKASGAGAVITITGGEISGTVVAENGGKILIIGGWFASDPTKDGATLAEGMMWDPETKYIRHKDYVAFIDDNDNGIVDDGEEGFREIEDAVAAENKTVKLLNNLTDAVAIEKNVTIDLNGYQTAAVTVKSGNAAIIDSSDNAGYGIDGETIVEEGAGIELRDVKTGTVKTSGKLTIGEGTEVESIAASTGADVVITDGTINDGISVLGGSVTIKGGRINGEIAIEEDADEDASIDIFSGIFGNPVPAEYCADGYIPVDYEDGTYGVELSVVRYIDLSKVAEGKIKAGDEVYIDGDAYLVGEDMTVEIPNAVAKKSVMVLTTYTYQNAGQAGAYPTAMYVWLVKGDKNADGDDIYDTFKTERISALDNFFKYEGTSIRVGNAKNGIRFFTSVHADNANKLMQGKLITSGDLAGVKMVSAGTEFWKTADNKQRSEVYGGKVGNTFRVFQSKGDRNWFTGVLTGLNTDAATIKETINNRPYAQLKLTDGTIVTLYGGTLGRSILYVATQNRNTFSAGTASDNFIEGLIAKGNK